VIFVNLLKYRKSCGDLEVARDKVDLRTMRTGERLPLGGPAGWNPWETLR
jgi:hypothetical protein